MSLQIDKRIINLHEVVESGTYPELPHIVAIGGIPVNSIRWKTFRLSDVLGLSGLLTFGNPKNRSVRGLGEICSKREHDWGYHWCTISMLLSHTYADPQIELGFLRDRRFWQSWNVGGKIKAFVMTASVKDWKRFISHDDDSDFNEDIRFAMKGCRAALSTLDLEYFGKVELGRK